MRYHHSHISVTEILKNNNDVAAICPLQLRDYSNARDIWRDQVPPGSLLWVRSQEGLGRCANLPMVKK